MIPVRLAFNTYVPVGGVDTSLSPVLFLHGFGLVKENWGDIPQNVANATRRKVFSLDARNHGDSVWCEEFSFDLNACDLIHFMETQEINKAIIVGHSMGAITGVKVGLKQPEKIEKLVAEDVTVKPIPEEMMQQFKFLCYLCKDAIQVMPADLDEKEAKVFIVDYIYSLLPKDMNINRKRVKEDLVCLKKDENGRYMLNINVDVLVRCLDKLISTEYVGKYEGPTCFIYGMRSRFKVYEEEDIIREHFPNVVFKGIEGASHNVHFDCPTEFTNVLLKFIEPMKSHI